MSSRRSPRPAPLARWLPAGAAPLLLALGSCAAQQWRPVPSAPTVPLQTDGTPRDGDADRLALESKSPAARTPATSAMAASAPAALDGDAQLARYVELALAMHPEITAAEHERAASLERVPQADAFPDPRLSYRYFIDEVETRVGPQEQALGLSWTVPWFGKRGLRRGMAERGTEAAEARLQAARARVVARLQRAYFEAYYLARAIEVIGRNLELVGSLERIARARYSAGGARHPDVIRAQLEVERLANELRSLEDRRPAVAARLASSVGLGPEAELPLPTATPALGTPPDEESVLASLQTANPELARLAHEAAREAQAVALARRARIPDPTFGIDWIDTAEARFPNVQGSGRDALSVTLGFALPLARTSYAAAIREARSRQRATASQLRATELELEATVREVLYRVTDARRRIELYEDTLVPKAAEGLAATEAAFRSGESSFLELVEAERLLLGFELARERTIADHGMEMAMLQQLTALGSSPPPARSSVEGDS